MPATRTSPTATLDPQTTADPGAGAAPPGGPLRILAVATMGAGDPQELRLRQMLERLPVEFVPFDYKDKRGGLRRLRDRIRAERPDLVVLEGSGLAGGLALLWGRFRYGVPYVVSCGDAIGPFLAALYPPLRPAVELYERTLYRYCAGFIGWTPYLTGRAMTFGAPRGMTAANWAPFPRTVEELAEARREVRRRLEIPDDAIVFGIAGSLGWIAKFGYCYGLELARALERVERDDVRVLIVGDGDGRPRLERLAEGGGRGRCLLPGRVPRAEVPDYLAAMDVASLPQSVDPIGSFRYTTKISEYLDAGLPIVTGRIPMAYDLDSGWLWRLPGRAPWDETYVDALAELLRTITREDLDARRAAVPRDLPEFDRARQVARVTAFLTELVADRGGPRARPAPAG
jgi:glycosyltransferase involved in cell wall biosynthesis